ncbi:unnamed protein product [Amaranthus hypochondriacus]
MDVNGKTEDGEFQPLLYTNCDEIGSSHTKREVNLRTQSLSSGIPHIGSSDSEQLPRTKSLQRSKTAPAKDIGVFLGIYGEELEVVVVVKGRNGGD